MLDEAMEDADEDIAASAHDQVLCARANVLLAWRRVRLGPQPPLLSSEVLSHFAAVRASAKASPAAAAKAKPKSVFDSVQG